MENTLGKISKNILEKLEFLKCPICLDIVENARELPCRHIFCSDCLETYKKENDTLSCPLCKKEISKRKLLSNDAALDTLCGFVKKLCDDVKVHHKSDIKTFFTNVFNKEISINKFKALSESEEIIPQSSEENIIPCTSKPSDKKKFKKKNFNTLKTVTKNVPKQIDHESKKNLVRDGNRKTQPKLGLSRKQSNAKVDNSVPYLKPNLLPQHQRSLHKQCSDKTKILQWLHDTRNRFERFSQTQNCDTQINTPQDVDMPSVSQILHKKTIAPKKCESTEKQLELNENKEMGCKRANSLENLMPSEGKQLRRHSLECTSPNKMKRFKNLQEMDNIENKLIIDIIEDEVLDVIDKEVSGEKNKEKIPLSSRKDYDDHENVGVTNTRENEFLDQLDNEMLGNCVDAKTKSRGKKIDFNSTEVGKENKSKSSWKSIKKFKKTIGKTKVPKRLDISLQSTQRSNKKEIESKMSDKSSNVVILENKTVDFQKMEDYFSKAIPQMIQNNIDETITSETKSDEDLYQKNTKLNEKINQEESKLNDNQEKDNDSDIYIYQTQPLSKEILDPKIDKISYAVKLTKKLDNILQELTKEDNIKIDELSSLLPSIQNIFKIFDLFENRDKWISPKACTDKIPICISEKQVQTDVFSLDGFPITPSAAFKSLVHEDVGTQTDNFCYECPHSYPEKITSTSPLIRSDSGRQSRKRDSFDKGISIESIVKESDSVVKSQTARANMLAKTSLVEEMEISHEPSIECFSDEKVMIPSLKKQYSIPEDQNANSNVRSNSQTSVAQVAVKQFNSATSNTSKIDGNNSICKIRDNKNESKLNTSQTSAIMCSLPQSSSGVNRRLMFEKTLKERKELEQTLKRARSENMSGSDDERPHKMKCNRFLQDDISIEFESESFNDNIESLRNSDVPLSGRNENSVQARNNSISCENSKNETCYKRTQNFEELIEAENNKNGTRHKKTQNLGEFTQADTLLNYCDDLIEKANRQISFNNVLSEHNDMNSSQILSKTPNNFQENEKFNLSVNKEYSGVKTQQVNEKIKTQDLLKHYDELIDKANKQIEMESSTSPNDHHKQIKYSCSQIPTTSKHVDISNSTEKVQEQKSQDLLDRYNALIEKTTKEIAQNEMRTLEVEDKNNKMQNENEDDFFCQNLDQLDSVLEKENKRLNPKEKLSESLFDTCKENLHDISDIEKKAMAEIMEEVYSTPKRRKTVANEEKVEKISKTKPNKSDGFNSSDDEIFSDVDVVETTPQKSLSFIERISCSQVVNQNSRVSLKFQENSEQFPTSINIVPPPPGFDDEDDKMEGKESEKMSNSERESENVIPNSLSPQKFEIPLPRRPLTSNSKKSLTTLSQQCMKVSPICPDKSKNLNVIEMVRQSKFSPLTIVPKPTSSVLTSTPKQKSILSYTKAKSKISQEAEPSISIREKSKPCIAFSRLSNAETLCVLSLCNKNLATRQDKFGSDVTHMVVSVDKHNHLKDHTIKFISAIAAGIWVVNIKWVQECLAKNYIVDEEPFEVLDITGTPSPRISRMSRFTNPLLKGFKFFIPRSFAQTSAEEVKNIIKLLQGDVVSSIEELVSSDREEYTRIIISELIDTEDYTQYENWLMTHKLLTVDINWLSLSVSRYKILSLRPHLICSDDSIDELGYPSNLVVDVAPTLTQDVSVFD